VPGDPPRPDPATNATNAVPPARNGAPAAARPASSGLAAARAAAAGAGRGPQSTAASQSAWSDGSPTEEAPYDPEYDGPVQAAGRNGGPAFEGFDPGDEPLDDVIDEKTARQSSEQQAVQLLRDALGAEKISES
jgi:DNA polymerase-3 subunit gamma/tau